MQIVGIGTEIIECVRIARMIQEHGERFLERVFTPKEMRHCQKRKNATERFAAQWAAKEAVLRALGIASVKGLDWTGLEIVHQAGRRSKAHLHGAIKELADKMKVKEILVATAHCRSYATAYALSAVSRETAERISCTLQITTHQSLLTTHHSPLIYFAMSMMICLAIL